MRRSQRIEIAAQEVVNAKPRQRTAAIEALRVALAIVPKAGHQLEINRAAVIERLANSESQASIASDLGVTRSAICKIRKQAILDQQLPG